jgi:hypothetical protein
LLILAISWQGIFRLAGKAVLAVAAITLPSAAAASPPSFFPLLSLEQIFRGWLFLCQQPCIWSGLFFLTGGTLRLFRCHALCLGLRVVAVTALALRCFPGLAREIDYFAGSLPTLITLATRRPARANAIAPTRSAINPLWSSCSLFHLNSFLLSSNLLEPPQNSIQQG